MGEGKCRADLLRAKPVVGELVSPQYPRRGELLADSASRTARWGKTASGAATFFLAISIGGCNDSPSTPNASQQTLTSQEANVLSETSPPRVGVVAPVFEHGEGSGSTGCIVMTPPVFLSEEEAMQIIKDELAKHGIALSGPT
ncbi:MAG TPA: hypothetical protein DD670_05880, partial [Planctomycetaceae bacterium]|nr:hypothetical protein [Planctomycetaceae bacterium]